MFILGTILLMPLLRLTRVYQLTSMADVLTFRFRSPWVGTCVTLAILTNQDTDFARGIEDDVRDLIVQSDTLSADSEAAKSLILGTVLEGIRYVHQNRERQRQFVEHLTAMMLCGLGATHQEATDLVHRTSIHIRGLALDNVEWWKDPWT